ncbi:MAG: phospholipase D family protein [Lysobacteraceae bacterium]|nr:MAG: phospholipase D family protein [Xanthomonadaceae bacterium]
MNLAARAMVLLLALAGTSCATLSPEQQARSAALVEAARDTTLTCQQADACATPSALHALGGRAFAESTPDAPRHYALILDRGQHAMLARLSLIRSATTAIDLQTYIFDEDDAGQLFLEELLAAARRGVRVRLLVDQLSALKRVDTLAALAGAHANFSIRIYNPVLNRARLSYPQYVLAAACCWRKLNQRMHTKLLLVDGAVGITGGRNYQDDYYDWDEDFNFRDRDVLVAGPVAREMGANFDAFWDDPRAVPPSRLRDVGRALLREGVPALAAPEYENPARVAGVSRQAVDPATIGMLAHAALPVGPVGYIADLPQKHHGGNPGHGVATLELRQLIQSARAEVLLQTPYLVLSDSAQELFRSLQQRPEPPRVIVSTNSLAATDSFITYALSYKYKRRYLRDFAFEIHESKPFPASAPIDLDATGASLPRVPSEEEVDAVRRQLQASRGDRGALAERYRRPLQAEYAALRYARRSANERVPLERAGVRIGMHAKSLVVDERVGVIGTHNFDPRGDHYNTESAVVIADPLFARALASSIRVDLLPANSWTIARRPDQPFFPGLEYTLAKISEKLPVFDLWPVRYATSYEFVPGPDCPEPLSPFDPRFAACYRSVGDFPEVALGFKPLLTRIFTAFGSGLAPIL